MTINDLDQRFPSPDWPQFLTLQLSETLCTLRLKVNPDITWFEGHFPQQPILAGVVQTHWAAELGKHVFAITKDVIRIDNLKFQSVVLPGQELQLQLEYFPETHALKFFYRTDELNFSEGKFVFQSASLAQQQEEIAGQ